MGFFFFFICHPLSPRNTGWESVCSHFELTSEGSRDMWKDERQHIKSCFKTTVLHTVVHDCMLWLYKQKHSMTYMFCTDAIRSVAQRVGWKNPMSFLYNKKHKRCTLLDAECCFLSSSHACVCWCRWMQRSTAVALQTTWRSSSEFLTNRTKATNEEVKESIKRQQRPTRHTNRQTDGGFKQWHILRPLESATVTDWRLFIKIKNMLLCFKSYLDYVCWPPWPIDTI